MPKDRHLTSSDLNKVLPAATAAEYKIINMQKRTSTKIFSARYGTIDFKTLSIAKAKELLRKRAPFIEKRKKPAKGSEE